jgi:hypothetical protein
LRDDVGLLTEIIFDGLNRGERRVLNVSAREFSEDSRIDGDAGALRKIVSQRDH